MVSSAIGNVALPSDNHWGVPVLSLDGQARHVELPLRRWGRETRKSRFHGTFHFFTEETDSSTYRSVVGKGLRKGGSLILATFAQDGPDRCSGLPVRRWSAGALASELGPGFRLIDSLRENHRTPWGAVQPFTWARFERI